MSIIVSIPLVIIICSVQNNDIHIVRYLKYYMVIHETTPRKCYGCPSHPYPAACSRDWYLGKADQRQWRKLLNDFQMSHSTQQITVQKMLMCVPLLGGASRVQQRAAEGSRGQQRAAEQTCPAVANDNVNRSSCISNMSRSSSDSRKEMPQRKHKHKHSIGSVPIVYPVGEIRSKIYKKPREHTDIQTYRHTDIQTYRHTHIHTDIQTYIFPPMLVQGPQGENSTSVGPQESPQGASRIRN